MRLNKVIVQKFVGLDESMSMHKLYVYQQNPTTLPFMQTLCKEKTKGYELQIHDVNYTTHENKTKYYFEYCLYFIL